MLQRDAQCGLPPQNAPGAGDGLRFTWPLTPAGPPSSPGVGPAFTPNTGRAKPGAHGSAEAGSWCHSPMCPLRPGTQYGYIEHCSRVTGAWAGQGEPMPRKPQEADSGDSSLSRQQVHPSDKTLGQCGPGHSAPHSCRQALSGVCAHHPCGRQSHPLQTRPHHRLPYGARLSVTCPRTLGAARAT